MPERSSTIPGLKGGPVAKNTRSIADWMAERGLSFENLHSLSVDSKGNIIVGETLGGHRAQLFRLIAQ